MDSRTLLDQAVFQLTPTRTRFELVLFSKGKKEKFASGLFEPFVSHMKFVRDEISKGGYSISLQPASREAPWFTKATFERFVRFVSTPAVLERFVILEAEITQIERSIQQNGASGTNLAGKPGEVGNGDFRKSSDSSKLKGENGGKDDASVEENSKIPLQRLLEMRKTLLRKEQAMVYARGLVAGFDKENMDDLISFADAFGASRLRNACTNFKELCKKKHADILWMEELAAVGACSPELVMGASGITLVNDSSMLNQGSIILPNELSEASKSQTTTGSDSSKDNILHASDQTQPAAVKYQVPMHWQNHPPHYMYNFQGPVPQFPFYQGYPLPPVQPAGLNYPGDLQQHHNRSRKSLSGKKEKLKKEADFGEVSQTESSSSDSESNSDSQVHQQDREHSSVDRVNGKKHRKKSSRTVVIRNINYITPNKRNKEKGQVYTGSSDEDDLVEKDSLKRHMDGAVGLPETSDNLHDDQDSTASKKGQPNDNWEALRDLLMRNDNLSVSGIETMQLMDVVRTSQGDVPTIPGAVDLESEKSHAKQKVPSDSFIATQRNGENDTSGRAINFINGEDGVLKRRDSVGDDFMIPNRIEESGNDPNDLIHTTGEKPSITRSIKEEEWFIVGQSVEPGKRYSMTEQNIFVDDHVQSVHGNHTYVKESHRERLVDDSFMVASRPEGGDQCDSQWKTDLSIAGDLILASQAESGKADLNNNRKEPNSCGPDDLCVILERDSNFESIKNSWTMEDGIDMSLTEATTRCSGIESGKSTNVKLPSDGGQDKLKGNGTPKGKGPGKETKSKVSPGSLRKSKAEIMSKTRKPSFVNKPMVQKGKLEQEEEMRKKMEEVLIQRQKRIAERTAAGAHASPASRKTTIESKTSKNSTNNRNLPIAQAANRVSSVKVRVA